MPPKSAKASPKKVSQTSNTPKRYRKDIVRVLQSKDRDKDYDKLPLIWIMDCAPVHTCAEFTSLLTGQDFKGRTLYPAVKEAYRAIVPVFVPARMTSLLQPLDVAFFGPAKKQLEVAHLDRVMERLTVPDGAKRAVRIERQTFTEYTRQELIRVIAEHRWRHNQKHGDAMRGGVKKAFDAIIPSFMFSDRYDVHAATLDHWEDTFVCGPDKSPAKAPVYRLFRHLEMTPEFVRAIRDEAAVRDAALKQVPFAKSTFTNATDPAKEEVGDVIDVTALVDGAAADTGSD